MKKTLLLSILSFAALSSFSQAGSPDNTFGDNGKVITPFTGLDRARGMAIQSDGKIVLAGAETVQGTVRFALARYHANGTPDNTFDGDGKLTTAVSPASNLGNAIAIQSDGKIVVAGQIRNASLNDDFGVVRYNSDGSLDNTFDSDGHVTTQIGTSADVAFSVAIQGDGKIVAAGYSFITGNSNDIALVRYNTDGSLDNTFDGDGKVTMDIAAASVDVAYAVVVQPDGKIAVAGSGRSGNLDAFALARFNADGTPDNTFDNDGRLTTSIGLGESRAYSLALQGDGKLVAAGYGSVAMASRYFAVARYNTNGSLDNTFDGDGMLTTMLGPSEDVATAVAIQSDGKIIAAGYSTNGATDDIVLVRYRTDGVLDATFDGDGKVRLDLGSAEQGWDMELVGSRIYVAGHTALNGSPDFLLTAFVNDGFALPISLASFTAAKQNYLVHLNWKTINEQNTESFEVERSLDGRSFARIGKVLAAGNSNSEKGYSFTDNLSVFAQLPSTVFYRLKTLDADGKTSFSKVLSVKMGVVKKLEVYPNPARNVLQLQTSEVGKYVVQIQDISGRAVKSYQVSSSAGILNTVLDISSLQKGTYILRVNGEKVKFVKQ
jgi:uncharacterized delta-60 repeat protein